MALVSLGTSTVAKNFNPNFLITSQQSPTVSRQFLSKTIPNFNIELESGVTVSYTIFAPNLPVVSVAANFIANPTLTVYDLLGPATVPNTGVGSRLPITSRFRNNVVSQKTAKQDNLKVPAVSTNTIYNAGNLPIVFPATRNYRAVPLLKNQNLRTTNTIFTNTNAVVNQLVVPAVNRKVSNFKTEKLRPVKASRLTVKSTTTFITAYSYWV
jgi:hypothetical protein